jgi:23S rRNA pseudouridine2605 synthase
MADTAGSDNERQRGERLQKYLAHAGIASRRHAEELIEAGPSR